MARHIEREGRERKRLVVRLTIGHMAKYDIETRLFINNEFVDAEKKNTFPLYNPATEEKVADVAEASAGDVDKAVAAAKKAFYSWTRTSIGQRTQLLQKLAELIQRDAEEFAHLEAISMGRPANQFKALEIPFAYYSLLGTANVADLIRGETSVQTPGFLNMTLYQPFGVVAGDHSVERADNYVCEQDGTCGDSR